LSSANELVVDQMPLSCINKVVDYHHAPQMNE